MLPGVDSVERQLLQLTQSLHSNPWPFNISTAGSVAKMDGAHHQFVGKGAWSHTVFGRNPAARLQYKNKVHVQYVPELHTPWY